MKFIALLKLVFFSLLLIPNLLHAEERGGHCQPPSCVGARFGKYCAGGLQCGIKFKMITDNKGKSVCVKVDSPPHVKCRDGVDVTNEESADKEETKDEN